MMFVAFLGATFYFSYLLLILLVPPQGLTEQEYLEYFKHNIMGMK